MARKAEQARNRRPFSRRLIQFVSALLYRAYSLSLIVLIGFLSWKAISYLMTSTLVSAEAPSQVTGLPKRLDLSTLQTHRGDWPATQSTPNPRSPLAHFHRLGGWVQPDIGNNCTTSGCHTPLPHSRRKETRAFLNMHCASMHCGVCHMASNEKLLSLTWYDVHTGRVSETPAIFRALERITSARGEPSVQIDETWRESIVDLLRQANSDADNNPKLTGLLQHFEVVRSDHEDFASLIETAESFLSGQMRGEYGHKLALKDATGRPMLAHPGSETAVAEFKRQSKSANVEQREKLIHDVHTRRRETPLSCGQCHVRQGGMVDFASLGYSPHRVQEVLGSLVVQMIEHINEGKPFYLPSVLEPRHAP